ncbi:MAG: hypothetical protein Q8919_06175 [Bacteroidota bacterium]|nr:hypothetical protein [Bacteroidota bacterium]
MNITNNLDTTRTIRCIDFTIGDRNAFSGIDNQFPLEIPPHQTRQIHIVFSPLVPNADSSGHFRTDVKIEPMSKDDACAPDFVLYGIAIKATDINTINPFSREPIHPTLKMSGTDETFGQTFLFQCLDKDSLRINAIALDNPDPHFVLSPMGACSSLPMVVLPGDYMAVRITLKTDDPSIYYNQLRFVLGNGQAPVVFDVEAMRIIQQNALTPSPRKDSIQLSIVPNPMSGSTTIAISGGSESEITIFDALGKVIDSRNNITTWRWDGKGAEGSRSPGGHYFIGATSISPSGKSVVITKQLVIER